MKRIGVLGGLGPESTLKYYRLIIDLCRERGLGGNYPEIIIYSLNFKECHDLEEAGRDTELVAKLVGGIQSLHRAGADFALIASNNPHIFFEEIKAKSPIPYELRHDPEQPGECIQHPRRGRRQSQKLPERHPSLR